LVWGSGLVTEITLDYTGCDSLPAASSAPSVTFSNMTNFSYRLRSSDSNAAFQPPQYAFINDTSNPDLTQQQQCLIQFDVPVQMGPSVLLYYKLTNFFQNHRRYVKSLDTDQLKGKGKSAHDLDSGDCQPVTSTNGLPIWPCGLIANSLFNDTDTNLTSSSGTYTWSENGIAWPGEAKKYSSAPGYPDLSQISPPPFWQKRFPNGYNSSNVPNLHEDEHFQNWMRTAALPTFTKLWGRNDDAPLTPGIYNITASMNFPVTPYKGTKSIVISTVSWMGGKNPFLGWAYVAASALFFALGVAALIRHLVKPRRLGDMSLLSWTR